MTNTDKYFGAPGTGKTRTELDIFEDYVSNGVPINQILYSTYRRNAADDTRKDLSERLKCNESDLSHVRTIHGECVSLLIHDGYFNERSMLNMLIDSSDYAQFNNEFAYSLNLSQSNLYSNGARRNRDAYLDFYHYVKSTGINPREACSTFASKDAVVDLAMVDFVADMDRWKLENNKIHYSDVLDEVYKRRLVPDCSVQIYDEVQDMTPSLARVAKLWSAESAHTVIAGDPLQTIYTYAGATPSIFRQWESVETILGVSHRLPSDVWELAGYLIKINTPYKIPKIKTRPEAGTIRYCGYDEFVTDLVTGHELRDVKEFHLVRTAYTAHNLALLFYSNGIPFTGIEDYAWSLSDIRLYNAMHNIRHAGQIAKNEYNELFEIYGSELLDSLYRINMLFKQAKGHHKQTIFSNALPTAFVNLIKSEDPFRFVKKKLPLFTKEKLMGALKADLPLLTPKMIENNQILTLHGSKGLESPKVYLHNELTQQVVNELNYPDGREHEAYCWYVGITRAKNELTIVNYNSKFTYPIPDLKTCRELIGNVR